MDILDYDTSARSIEGAYMPFVDPSTGEPVRHRAKGDKEERELHLVLLGPEAPESIRVFKQLQHRASKKGANHSPSDAEIESERVSDAKAVARLVVGGLLFSADRWVDITRENAGDFLYKVGPLRGQAVKFILDEGNFTTVALAA